MPPISGFPLGNKFALSNFRYPQRREEAKYAKEFFENWVLKLQPFPTGYILKDRETLLTTGGKYFLGWGKRSSKEAKAVLSKKLGIKFIEFGTDRSVFLSLGYELGSLE